MSTTAVYTTPAMICINDGGIAFRQPPQIFHYLGGVWTLISLQNSTTTGNMVCGTTNSFSPFALFQPAALSTATSIGSSSVTYGTAASATVSVVSSGGTVSGNVTLSVDGGPATSMSLSNGSATFNIGVLAAGTYALAVNYAEQGSFLASAATGAVTVTPATITITANNQTKSFDSSNPALTWNATGFVNGDTVGVLSSNPTCATTATTSSPVGTYPINCSGAAALSYSFVYVAGTLTVTCHYVSIGFSPSTVALGGLLTITANVRSCSSAGQTVKEQFTLSGPLQPKTCGQGSTVMFTTPPLNIRERYVKRRC